jgi:integrase
LEIERISQVRDIFLFSGYTGLAYTDTKNLRGSQIIIGIDGEQRISTSRQRTDAPTKLPLPPKAVEIMDKYASHSQISADGTLLPVLSNQKMNAYLMEIADVCGISKTSTYHTARHTFASTLLNVR